jgi:hypothetical protein
MSCCLFKIHNVSETGFYLCLQVIIIISWVKSVQLIPISGHLHLSLSLMLQPAVSWPVCLGIKHLFGAYDQIFITVRQLRVCWCGALSLTREQVCHLQLLLVLASAFILGSESGGIRDHILLSQIRNFHFYRLLRLAGIWWRYSTPPSHGIHQHQYRVEYINEPQHKQSSRVKTNIKKN